MRSLLATALATCLATAPLAASEVHVFSGLSFADVWSGVGSGGHFGRAQTGELNGNGVLDALVFDGDHPVVVFDPDQYYASIDVPATANDGGILRAVDGISRGAVALVGSSGLKLAVFDPANAAFSVNLVQGGAWAGARIVRCANLNGTGGDDLLGVGADKRTLLRLMRTGESTFSAAASIVSLADVIDVVPLQWDLDANSEIAVLSTAGLTVFDDLGYVAAFWPSVLPGGAISRLHQAGNARDRLVWVTAYAPPAQQWLVTVSPLGFESWLDLGSLDVVACIGADFDADGDDDLLISHRYSHDLVWIENERSPSAPNAMSFTGAADRTVLFQVAPSASGAPENSAWPACGDLDGDGDLDIVIGSESTGAIETIRGNWRDESLARVGIGYVGYSHPQPQQGTLAIDITAPSAMPSNANRLQVDLRRRPSATGALEQLPIAQIELAVPTSWPAHVALPIPETLLGFSNVYDVQLRLVWRDTSGLRASYPTTQASFAMLTVISQALIQAPGALGSIHVDAVVPEDATLTPIVVPAVRLHHYPPNLPPKAVAITQ